LTGSGVFAVSTGFTGATGCVGMTVSAGTALALGFNIFLAAFTIVSTNGFLAEVLAADLRAGVGESGAVMGGGGDEVWEAVPADFGSRIEGFLFSGFVAVFDFIPKTQLCYTHSLPDWEVIIHPKLKQ